MLLPTVGLAVALAVLLFGQAGKRDGDSQWLRKEMPAQEERTHGYCQLLRKETLAQGRGEPVRRFTFRTPPGSLMNVDTALRQVVVVRFGGHLRMYSPTSEPCRPDGTFDLVIRVYRGGRVSRWLDAVPVGGTVSMTWPWPFALRADRRNPGRRVGLVAFGVGITELYCVAAKELRDPGVREVALLYSTRTAEEQQVLGPELEALAAQHPGRFRLERTLTRERAGGCRAGRVCRAMLAEVFPWADASRGDVRFVASGTRQMMDETYGALERLGFEPARFKLIRDNTWAGMLGLPWPRSA